MSEFLMDQAPVTSIGVYEVTRHYGGPEEGGWWYNWTRHLFSVPIRSGSKADFLDAEAWLSARFEDQGNIYSVRGGVQYAFLAETTEGQHADTKRPHYE